MPLNQIINAQGYQKRAVALPFYLRISPIAVKNN